MVSKSFMAHTAALLPTGKRMNLLRPEAATFYDREQVAYIVTIEGRPRILTSFGDLGPNWEIGTSHDIRHDQTLRELGRATVVGIVEFRSGQSRGTVPAGTFPHWVFK